MTKIIIVDKNDNIIGAMTKEEALLNEQIRRVSSVFLVEDGKVYLQKRAANKDVFPNR